MHGDSAYTIIIYAVTPLIVFYRWEFHKYVSVEPGAMFSTIRKEGSCITLRYRRIYGNFSVIVNVKYVKNRIQFPLVRMPCRDLEARLLEEGAAFGFVFVWPLFFDYFHIFWKSERISLLFDQFIVLQFIVLFQLRNDEIAKRKMTRWGKRCVSVLQKKHNVQNVIVIELFNVFNNIL